MEPITCRSRCLLLGSWCANPPQGLLRTRCNRPLRTLSLDQRYCADHCRKTPTTGFGILCAVSSSRRARSHAFTRALRTNWMWELVVSFARERSPEAMASVILRCAEGVSEDVS